MTDDASKPPSDEPPKPPASEPEPPSEPIVPGAEFPQAPPAELAPIAGELHAPTEYPPMQTGPVAPADEPILPTTYDDNALRDAVGAPVPQAKRMRKAAATDDGEPRVGGGKKLVIGAVILIAGLLVGTFAFLGHANSQRYVIACATDKVSAEEGRSFPPWGSRPLTGPEWKPIALPPNAECKPRETQDLGELERWFLELLMDRASTILTARNLLDSVQAGKPNPLDIAAEHLNQALLLSRAPERRDQRKEVERLLGDVQYWRATLRLREASAALVDASRQFDAASAQRPRHVTDAGEWASFLRRLVGELQAGPTGVTAAPGPSVAAPGPDREPAPAGTALPVEPEGSASEPVTPVDAGLPTGGVLL